MKELAGTKQLRMLQQSVWSLTVSSWLRSLHLCRAGLLDGPVALVSSLLAFGGSSAASLEVQQAGLASAVVATATSGRDSPVLELSPTGALRNAARLQYTAAWQWRTTQPCGQPVGAPAH